MNRYSTWLSVILIMAILLTTLSFMSGAQPEAYSLTAQNIKIISANPGSTVKFTGNGDLNSNVNIQITTSTTVGVENGRYSISLSNVYIPGSSNSFSVTASNVQTMTFAGYYAGSKGISYVKDIALSGGKGTFSVNNVPSDKYNVMVYGQASGPTVNIDASASCVIPTDKRGKYSGSVSTSGMPKGVYYVKQDGQTVAIVYLGVPVP